MLEEYATELGVNLIAISGSGICSFKYWQLTKDPLIAYYITSRIQDKEPIFLVKELFANHSAASDREQYEAWQAQSTLLLGLACPASESAHDAVLQLLYWTLCCEMFAFHSRKGPAKYGIDSAW